MKVKNSREYVDPAKYRMIALVYALSGTGKTMWIGTCPPEKTGIAACETGVGKGVLTIAYRGFDVCEPKSLSDLQEVCSGKVFPDKEIIVIDSLTAMVRTFVKDAALQIPRTNGESPKRKAGVPELDDYLTMGEFTRRTLHLLFQANEGKHIIVTALERYDKVGPDDPPGTESRIGPDLPGSMFMAAPAMFDLVLRMKTRSVLRDPKDAKSRYSQRYFITDQITGVIARCRPGMGTKNFLDLEENFVLAEDISNSVGGFT